jgi:hypothetical protein
MSTTRSSKPPLGRYACLRIGAKLCERYGRVGGKLSRPGLALPLLALAPVAVVTFSGEDPLGDADDLTIWHHQGITHAAATACGFPDPIARLLAWHADYVDSYLYNPLWWIQGGYDRIRAALASAEPLAKLHFDDLFSTIHVRQIWQRYFYGTLAGLIWAAERGDCSAAYNILGTSLHAMQDFYAHSSWVDLPERRIRTWFEFPPSQRHSMDVWTGAYERPVVLGRKPHGKIVPAATIFQQPGVNAFMEIACSALSPLAETGLCKLWRDTKGGTTDTRLPKVAGFAIPPGVVYLAPPGIALDSTWSAKIGAAERGVTDIPSDLLFEAAKNLATRCSIQWLQLLEHGMAEAGQRESEFWTRLKDPRSYAMPMSDLPTISDGERVRRGMPQYEEFYNFPYQFITAGVYPPETSGEEHFLRVRLRTAAGANTGTNAAIFLTAPADAAGEHRYPLDYTPITDENTSPIFVYNDFEEGESTVYTVGPFARLPRTITLVSEVPSAGEVGEHIIDALKETVLECLDSIRHTLLTIIHGNADEVGHGAKLFDSATLGSLSPGQALPFAIPVGSSADGEYVVRGELRCLSRTPADHDRLATGTFAVRLTRLECQRETPLLAPTPRRLAVPAHAVAEGDARNRAAVAMQRAVGAVELAERAGMPELAAATKVAAARLEHALQAQENGGGGAPLMKISFGGVFDDLVDTLEDGVDSILDEVQPSDEPFVLALLLPTQSPLQKLRMRSPLEGIDSGEGGAIQLDFNPVTEPLGGQITVAVMVMESDLEVQRYRDDALNAFAGEMDRATTTKRRELLDALAARIGPDWKLGQIEAYAFSRAVTRGGKMGIEVGQVLSEQPGAWIAGGSSREFRINPSGVRFVPLDLEQCWFEGGHLRMSEGPVEASAVLPPVTSISDPTETMHLLGQRDDRIVWARLVGGKTLFQLVGPDEEPHGPGGGWGWKLATSVSDALNFLNGVPPYNGPVKAARVVSVWKGSYPEITIFYQSGGAARDVWKHHAVANVDEALAVLNAPPGVEEAYLVRVAPAGLALFYRPTSAGGTRHEWRITRFHADGRPESHRAKHDLPPSQLCPPAFILAENEVAGTMVLFTRI